HARHQNVSRMALRRRHRCCRTQPLRYSRMDIRIENISKTFGQHPAVNSVSLEIRSGELIALLGPSGSGKTTLLRLIAGLEHPTGGRIFFGDEDASRKSVQARNVGFVF